SVAADHGAAAGRGQRVRGLAEAMDRRADVRLAGALSPIEQGLRGDNRQQHGVDSYSHDPSDGTRLHTNIGFWTPSKRGQRCRRFGSPVPPIEFRGLATTDQVFPVWGNGQAFES